MREACFEFEQSLTSVQRQRVSPKIIDDARVNECTCFSSAVVRPVTFIKQNKDRNVGQR